MKPVLASALEKCQVLLEALQNKSQQKHLIFWSQLNPDLKNWNETARGYLKSFDLVQKYRDAKRGVPRLFSIPIPLRVVLNFLINIRLR